MKTFAVGDRVEWESSAGGRTACKVGAIVCTVPVHMSPNRALARLGVLGKVDGAGMQRDHVSYVVRASVEGRKASRLYWPRVNKLRPV